MRKSERGEKFLDPKDMDFKKHLEQKKEAKHVIDESCMIQDRLEGEFGDLLEKNNGTVNSWHGLKFIGDVLPRKIAELRASGKNRKLQVLNSGAGLGLYNAQIRESLGRDVNVIGTSLSNLRHNRKEIVEKTKNEVTERQNQLSQHHPDKNIDPYSVKRKILIAHTLEKKHKKIDQIRESVLELRDFEEFDVILDTYGELHYASKHDHEKQNQKKETTRVAESESQREDEFTEFHKVLEALVSKLLSSGELYIASLYKSSSRYLWQNAGKLEKKYGIKIFFDNDITKEDILKLLPKNTKIDYDSVHRILHRVAHGRSNPSSKELDKQKATNVMRSIRDGLRYKIVKNAT
ncbi:MAG: hypothetical protein COX81_02400 [Candidatus Magasanikbacteria bacterium CG_4_10_14_0_2_um_filter_37_12]|uniref:Uncharacterized protein n=1 Tax=Candidatus Magasanikbacteria bacterium CG_4_10_14_0_2_um_filter_37_12 TaxID=1974637 RepID=A0A2M7V828_9BACT|nr:MAG: hypothetical protein COX81_02400 [Candidatus Magasanikbacteria bacterium CG_4_10_14_0_2_um_filter_37_12]